MASTYTDNGGGVANGSKLDFTFTFPVIQTEDVRVELNALVQETTKYTVDLTSNPTKITFNNTNIDSSVQESTGAPKSGVLVRVFRQTIVGKANGDEDPKAIYAAGSSIRAIDLNANREQALYAIHELQNKPISNSIIADGAITSAKIKDGTITNDDVSTTAAIDGTKISPNFGSQNIVTSGTVDGRDVSVDGTKLDTIESNATADQTAAEIRTLVEAADDSNVFTNDDHDKLANIESGATADQTADDIKTLLQNSPLGSTHLDTNSVGVSQIADSELTTLAGMQSGTASILADATALTSTIAELNQLDGMTKESSITDDDDKFPTSGAVVDYVAAQIAPIGGLEVIATDALFPNTQPPSGVVISIADAGGLVVNGSGTSTTARTVGGSTVTINNIASNFNNSTVDNGVAFLVSSTGSGQTYNYHKATLKEADLLNLSNDINDFAARYRVGASNPTSNLDGGDLFYNTTINKLLVYNSNTTAWEETQVVGDFNINTLSSSSATGGGSATFNGSAYRFNLSHPPTSAAQMLVSINGVIQKPNAGSSRPSEGFAIDGGDIIFSAAPANGADFFIVTIGAQVSIGTPSSNTVSTSILQNGSVTDAKVNAGAAIAMSKLALSITNSEVNASAAIAGSKISPDFGSQAITTTGSFTGADLTLNSTLPKITFTDSDGNPDYVIQVNNGQWTLRDVTNSSNIMRINPTSTSVDNTLVATSGFDVSQGGADITGNITVTGTVDGRDVAADGTKLDGIEASATADQTASEIVALVADQTIAPSEIDMEDNEKIKLGTGDDLQIYHDGTESLIQHTGAGVLKIEGNGANNVFLRAKTAENSVTCKPNGAVELYYDNSKKFETASDGILASGAIRTNAATSGAASANQATFDFNSQNARLLSYHSSGSSISAFTNPSGGSLAERFRIDADGHVLIPVDSKKLQIGASQDLALYHDGSNSFIDDAGTGYLRIRGSEVRLQKPSSAEDTLRAIADGAVELYYDNSKKLETTSTGIYVDSNIRVGTTTGSVSGGNALIMSAAAGSRVKLCRDATGVGSSDGFELIASADSTAYLWNREDTDLLFGTNGTERLRIKNDGNIQIPADSKKLQIGAGQDLELYHTGSGSYIADTGTGNLHITTNQLQVINGANTELQATFLENDAVSLYYDNSKKLETNSSGVNIVGSLTVNGSAISSGGLGNIVEDTSPQLGGDLQSNGNDIDFADNDAAFFGTGNDLKIFHSGSHSQIIHSGTGNLYLDSIGGSVNLRAGDNAGGVHNSVVCNLNEDVELYYDNVKKFETTSTGIAVTGRGTFTDGNSGGVRIGNSDDLQLYHDTVNSYIRNNTGFLIIEGGTQNSSILIRPRTTENSIKADSNGTVELYYDNSKKFETDSSGSIITGRLAFNNTGSSIQLADNQKTTFGNGQDLQIFHTGSHAKIVNSTGQLQLLGDIFRVNNAASSESMIAANANGAVELYYDSSKKLHTHSGGITISGHTGIADGYKYRAGSSDDLQIYHSTYSYINNSTSWLLIQSDLLALRSETGTENYLTALANGTTALYYDNVNKFQTSSTGGQFFGKLHFSDGSGLSGANKVAFGDSEDLQIYHDGNNSVIAAANVGDLQLFGNADDILLQSVDDIFIKPQNGESGVTILGNAQTELYFDNSKKFQTSSQGCYFLGDDTHWSQGHIYPWNNNDYNLGSASYRWANAFISQAIDFQDSAKAQFGNSDDLQIFHDGGHARINNLTGYITSNSASGHILRSGSSETMLRTEINAEVKLYYDNSEKLRTTTNGAKVTGNYIELDKGSSSGTAFIIDTTATSGATRFRFRENGNTKGQIVYSHDNDQIELAGDSGQSAAILVNFSEYALRAIANGATEVYYNGSKKFQTTSSGTELFNRAQLTQSSNDFVQKLDASNSGYSTNIIKIHATRGAATNWAFLAADSNHGGGADREFTLRGDGHGYCDGSWNSNGADYAEYFESSTGSAIAVGTTVVLENNKVRAATSSDAVADIIGVVRPKDPAQASTTIGNAAWNKWHNKYLTDDFDRYILDEHNVIEWTDEDGKEHSYQSHAIPSDVTIPSDAKTLTEDEDGNKFVHYRTNPDYDPTKTYVPRHDRDEWVIIGLVGQVKVLKGQAINDRWVKMRDVSDTVQQYFIR